MSSFKKNGLFASSLLAGAALLTGAPAMAQQAKPAVKAEPVEEVIVTGTRVARPDVVSNSPISTVTAATLSQQNVINLEQQLRVLPQFSPGDTEFANNTSGSVGVSTINLRDLGTNRTLVLMDGKRLPPFGIDGVVDINNVPTALVERIDIVTGGASAVYGSDAVAGVVNFITKRNFQGFQADVVGSQYGAGDGRTMGYNATLGGNFLDDRGNATLSFSYTDRQGVKQGDRDYSTNAIDGTDSIKGGYGAPTPITSSDRIFGSSNAAATRLNLGAGNRWLTPAGGVVTGGGLPTGTAGLNNSVFNFNPFNYFQVPQKRYQAAASARYEINKFAEVYGRALYVNSQVPTELAPSAYFGGSTATNPVFRVNVDNPFLSAAQQTAFIARYNALNPTTPFSATAAPGSQTIPVAGIRRRLIELGNRIGINDSQTFQTLIGVEGEIGDTGFRYDANYSFGRVNSQSATLNDVDVEKARVALIAIPNPLGGAPICLSGGACRPVNIFSGSGAIDPTTGLAATGNISPEALAFIGANNFDSTVVDQEVFTASVSGALNFLKSPAAEDATTVAFGFERRTDSVDYRPDELTRTGNTMGSGATSPAIIGSIDTLEYFGEAFIPLISGKPGFQSLGLELGARYSDNSEVSDAFTSWKVGGEWVPVDGFRARAMLQKAVRAPNLGEQFQPRRSGLENINADPCASTVAVPTTPAQIALANRCLAQGAPTTSLGQIQNPAAQQAAVLVAGAKPLGVSLVPEEADTLTVGFQLSPSALPGFTASVDYYSVEIEDAIASLGAQEIVDNCFVQNIASFCALITRNPALGILEGRDIGILKPIANRSIETRKGVDYTFGYRFDLPDNVLFSGGRMTFDLSGTHLLESTFKSASNTPVIKCEGFYAASCDEPSPVNKLQARLGLSAGRADVGFTWRHLSSVKAHPDEINSQFGIEVKSIPAFNYLDFGGSFDVTKNVRVTASVQNLLDKDPPIVGQLAGNNTSFNTYGDTYDPLGRRFGMALRVKY